MGLVYMIASGKGGTGKTSVSAGLASALSILGRKVCAVDMDAGPQFGLSAWHGRA